MLEGRKLRVENKDMLILHTPPPQVYFDYLQRWVQVSTGHILEEEWKHVKEICTHIRGGEAEAGRRFW